MILRCLLLLAMLLGFPAGGLGQPPPDRVARLARGINVTNWFRYPGNAKPAALRAYLSDTAIDELRKAGFTAVRIAVQPEFLLHDATRYDLLIESVARVEWRGLAVVIALHPAEWRLETSETDRTALRAVWNELAPRIRSLDPRLTFPELLNEPVFPGMPDSWARLQHEMLASVRASLPDHTVVLTGNDWGSVAGLLALRPEPDANVVYSFHFYEPAELTSLAAYRAGLDREVLARLPFPVDDRGACFRLADQTDPGTAGLIRFYCGLRWTAGRVGDRIDSAAAWARRNHAVVLLGEFGASAKLAPDSRFAWLKAVREHCERAGIGWTLWGYDDVMGFGVPPPPQPRPALDRGVLRSLGLDARGE